jgi:hypothetical protein
MHLCGEPQIVIADDVVAVEYAASFVD